MWLSAPKFGGGPGRALCTPTFHGLSDGPYRRIAFRQRPVRHNYRNVLLFSDVRKLIYTAQELLQLQDDRKSNAFWEVYSKRVKKCALWSPPAALAIVAQSFDAHNQDTGIYVDLANALSSRILETDAHSLVLLADVFSRRLKQDGGNIVFQAIITHLPNVLYQLSCEEIVKYIVAMSTAKHFDMVTCSRLAKKLEFQVAHLDHNELAEASAAFATMGYRNLTLYSAFSRRAAQITAAFKAPTFYKLLTGFSQNGVRYDDLLKSFGYNLSEYEKEFSSKQRRVLNQLIVESELPIQYTSDIQGHRRHE